MPALEREEGAGRLPTPPDPSDEAINSHPQDTPTLPDFDGASDGIHRPGHPLEAEAAVLGAMILSGEALDGCARRLEPDDFVREAHRTLFDVLIEMERRGDSIDQITVNAELSAIGRIDVVGGVAAVWHLTDPATCPTPSSWPTYATVVAREARRRRGIAKLERALERLRAGEDPAVVARDVGVNA